MTLATHTLRPDAHHRRSTSRRGPRPTHLLATGVLALALIGLGVQGAAEARGLHRGPGVHHAHAPVLLEAPTLNRGQLEGMRDPVILDRARLDARVAALSRRLARLERVAAGVQDPGLRASLENQIDQARAELDAVYRQLARAHSVVEVVEVVEVYDEPLALLPDTAQYAQLRRSLDQIGFHDERLDALGVISNRHVFTTAQVRGLAEMFPFNDDRLDALVMLYPRTVDPENYHTLMKLLPFSNHRARLLSAINRSDTGRRALPSSERRRRR